MFFIVTVNLLCFAFATKVHENVSVKQIEQFFKKTHFKKIVTIAGISDPTLDYEAQTQSEFMTTAATLIFHDHDPKTTLINSYGFKKGVGNIVDVARKQGFNTSAIASMSQKDSVEWQDGLDHLFLLNDTCTGGMKVAPKFQINARLCPVSAARVSVSTEYYAFGGSSNVTAMEVIYAQNNAVPSMVVAGAEALSESFDYLSENFKLCGDDIDMLTDFIFHVRDRCGKCGGSGESCPASFDRISGGEAMSIGRRAPPAEGLAGAPNTKVPVMGFDLDDTLITSDPNDPTVYAFLPGAIEKVRQAAKTHVIVIMTNQLHAKIDHGPLKTTTASVGTTLTRQTTSTGTTAPAATTTDGTTTAASTTSTTSKATKKTTKKTTKTTTKTATTTGKSKKTTSTTNKQTTVKTAPPSTPTAANTVTASWAMYDSNRRHRNSKKALNERRRFYPKGEYNETFVSLMERKVEQVIEQLKVPAFAFLSYARDEGRKPEIGMFNAFRDFLQTDYSREIESFTFVGDAGGREGDFSCADRLFLIGVKEETGGNSTSFLTPQQWLLGTQAKQFNCSRSAFKPSTWSAPATNSVGVPDVPTDNETGLAWPLVFLIGVVTGCLVAGIAAFLKMRNKSAGKQYQLLLDNE